MAEAKKKRPSITSPIGTFRFPKLTEPDFGNEKFPKPDGEYSVQLVLRSDSDEFKKLMAVLKPHYEEALEEAKKAFDELPVGTRKKLGKITTNELFTTIYDKETEEPTGEVVFKASMKASGLFQKGPKAGQKWTRKPVIFDAKGARMMNPPAIWGGSQGRINVELSSYFIPATGIAGMKMHLVGAQVTNLVSTGERSASSMGFGAVDGGYEHTEEAPAETAPAGDASGEDGGDF